MRLRISILALCGMLLSFAGFAWAFQDVPLNPRIKVNFQQPVIVDGQTLSPGEYYFRHIGGPGEPPVFRVATPQGTNLTLSAVAIRGQVPASAASGTPPSANNTEVVLQEVNGKYYLDKIWVQGRTIGWDFQMPQSVKSQGNMKEHVIQGTNDSD